MVAKSIAHFDSNLAEIEKPELKVVLGILNRARLDAEAGDISALAFLITEGEKLENYIFSKDGPATGRWNNASPSLEFSKRIWQKIQNGDIIPFWSNKEDLAEDLAGIKIPGKPHEGNRKIDYNTFPMFAELEKVDIEN